MKLFAYVKLTLIQSLRESGQLLLVFAIFPIAISAMLAYFQKDLFVPTTEVPKMIISISDEDKSKLSSNLVDFLSSESMKKLVEIKAATDKVDYELLIPKDYEEKFITEKKNTVTVRIKEGSSNSNGETLSNIIQRYSEDINIQLIINEKIKNDEAISSIANNISKIYSTDTFISEIVQLKKNLSSYECFSVALLGFMFLMMITSLAASFYLEQENGMYQRVMSTAITKVQYYNYNLATCFIFALMLNFVYVFSYRLLGLSFKVSIPLLLLLILLQSLLATASTALVVAFLSKKNSSTIMTVLMLLQVILGGGFIPFEQMGASKFIIQLSKFSPDALLSKSYKNLLLYDNFSSISFYCIAILIVSIVFYSIGILKINLKWGESK
jgi:ABC-2 type transport system permease protein